MVDAATPATRHTHDPPRPRPATPTIRHTRDAATPATRHTRDAATPAISAEFVRIPPSFFSHRVFRASANFTAATSNGHAAMWTALVDALCRSPRPRPLPRSPQHLSPAFINPTDFCPSPPSPLTSAPLPSPPLPLQIHCIRHPDTDGRAAQGAGIARRVRLCGDQHLPRHHQPVPAHPAYGREPGVSACGAREPSRRLGRRCMHFCRLEDACSGPVACMFPGSMEPRLERCDGDHCCERMLHE
eukprot:359139-Chlamydomonas_euryale.AAC.19